MNDRDGSREKPGPVHLIAVFGAAGVGAVLVVGAIGWYALRHRSDPWTPADFAQSGALLALGLALLIGAFWWGQRFARPAPEVPAPPVSWASLVLPVVGGIGLILKGILGWSDRWVMLHIPFAMILSVLAGALFLFSARFTVQQLRAQGGWSRRPSWREALDELFPAVFVIAMLIPERWSGAADIVMAAVFVLFLVTRLWERLRPTGPSL